MFFDNMKQQTLRCPYCNKALADVSSVWNTGKYTVIQEGFFQKGEVSITCTGCFRKVGINVKH